jgi:hypothetical protein
LDGSVTRPLTLAEFVVSCAKTNGADNNPQTAKSAILINDAFIFLSNLPDVSDSPRGLRWFSREESAACKKNDSEQGLPGIAESNGASSRVCAS